MGILCKTKQNFGPEGIIYQRMSKFHSLDEKIQAIILTMTWTFSWTLILTSWWCWHICQNDWNNSFCTYCMQANIWILLLCKFSRFITRHVKLVLLFKLLFYGKQCEVWSEVHFVTPDLCLFYLLCPIFDISGDIKCWQCLLKLIGQHECTG